MAVTWRILFKATKGVEIVHFIVDWDFKNLLIPKEQAQVA
jgi:hypothetical protein